DVAKGRSRVTFHPLTGRTHQLRVHAASEQGLGMSITGDRLYGITPTDTNQRLHLHAHRLEFTFPADGRHYRFESPVPF
ncbi:MAG: RluA family pseudouridine synthase, partial [Muribaculaceae bacterium]|nr:RluA family pseudouridine synthase [Muribaculaceae bacterium]